MSEIDDIYRRRIDAMTVAEKFERTHALLHWARSLYATQLREQLGAVSDERLKWEVALRQYGSDARMRRLIETRLQDVESRGVLSDARTRRAGA